MDYAKMYKISACFTIVLQSLAYFAAQDLDECYPRCWKPVQQNTGVYGATKQQGVAEEEECKALCINNGTCIGLDWDKDKNQCWFQFEPLNLYNNRSNVNHWSLANNCTDDCASYCWRAVQIGLQVKGGTLKPNVSDENHCKSLCSITPNCTGVDWYSFCYLIFTEKTLQSKSGVRHWGIKRNLPTTCPEHFTYTTTVRAVTSTSITVNQTTLSNKPTPTDGIASNSILSLLSSTKSPEESTTECSSNMKPDLSECSPRCWNPVQQNSGVIGAIYQGSLKDEEDCKTLCINNGRCIGLDWVKNYNECWFQLGPMNPYNRSNVNHWSLANCTGDCASFCWKAVLIGFQLEGSTQHKSVVDENRCKLLCSKTQSCTGVDWDSPSCYLILTDETLKYTYKAGVRHWGIKRNLPNLCSGTSSTVNQTTLSNNTSPTDSIASNSMSYLLSSTKSPEERTTESSSNMKTGIIVLATLLGLCILIIIGFVINTIKLLRENDKKNTKMDDNYEDLRRPNTTERSESVTYTDLVQRNPNESAYEQ